MKWVSATLYLVSPIRLASPASSPTGQTSPLPLPLLLSSLPPPGLSVYLSVARLFLSFLYILDFITAATTASPPRISFLRTNGAHRQLHVGVPDGMSEANQQARVRRRSSCGKWSLRSPWIMSNNSGIVCSVFRGLSRCVTLVAGDEVG